MTDKERLRSLKRQRSAQTFRPLLDAYLVFVYSAARRQTSSVAEAAEATRAVLVALAHKARTLSPRTLVAEWLFRATRFACLKLTRKGQPASTLPPLPSPLGQPSVSIAAGEASRESLLDGGREVAPVGRAANLLASGGRVVSYTELAPHLDQALERLPTKLRKPILLRVLLNSNWTQTAQLLRTNERRAQKRAQRGVKKLAKRLRQRGLLIDSEDLTSAFPNECWFSVPEGLAAEILTLVEAGLGKRPKAKLVRQTLRAIYWAPWRRRLKLAGISLALFLVLLTIAGFYTASLWRSGRFMAWLIKASILRHAKSVPGFIQPARSWPNDPAQPLLKADALRKPADLYQTTNIWLADLKFSAFAWRSLEPKRVDPMPDIFQPDGTILLRNPKAQRSGLAGVLGYDFEWARANLEFGGVRFENVGARFKGNGTYLVSLSGSKRSFKVDLKRFSSGQQLAGVEEINFTNLIEDRSYMSDALAYELFRDAGVPAPRTAYAWLTVTVEKQPDRKPLGLYLLVENVGGAFAAQRFGSKKTPVFKPVTYRLFEDLGDDWSAYGPIYDLKTRASGEQEHRVIEFSRLVSHAADAEFAERIGDYLDLDEFARFLACLVLLSSYDGFLSDGQNFYVYLHPVSGKFGFIPWDLDHAWGGFYLIATPGELERASIWHPWIGRNRFLERVMAVAEFRKLYRVRLEELLAGAFVPSRLSKRIDEIAQMIRSPIAAESAFRLERFDQAVSAKWTPRSSEKDPMGPDRPVHQLKRFIETRAKSVRQQLDGKSKGMRITHRENG